MKLEHYTYQKDADDFRVQYDISIPVKEGYEVDADIEFQERVSAFLTEFEETEEEIERLTNHADGVDYAIAVSSGLLAGLIDIFFVGAWNFATAKAISNRIINGRVMDFAKKNGFQGSRLSDAVAFLEQRYPLPGDNAWKGAAANVSAKSHHLDDFSHHPTVIGLVYSISAQFTGQATYINRAGEAQVIPIMIDANGMLEGKTPSAKVSSGIINWCFQSAKNRRGHLYSDMAGSSSTAGKGMGLPGTLMSTFKEISTIPGFDNPNFSENLYRAFANGIGSEKRQIDLGAFNALFEGADSKFDLRTETAITHELKRQAVPVVINEILVRSLYFVRRLTKELKSTSGEMDKIDWKKVVPFHNRTIARMITISMGTFEVVDIADAAIRAAIKSGLNPELFAAQFVLRVNFVGLGRFTIACVTDYMMGVKKNRLELAMASGQTAKVAVSTVNLIDDIEIRQRRTDEKLDRLEMISQDMSEWRF